MLNQTFTVKGFKSIISAQDFRKDPKVRNIEQLTPFLEQAATEVSNKTINFDSLFSGLKRGKIIFSASDLKTNFLLKKANDNVRRVFRVKQNDRTALVRIIEKLIIDSSSYYIIKSDIKSFYESVPRERILLAINNNNLLSNDSKLVVSKIFSAKPLMMTSGLPRGLGISATLSEIYLKYFDNNVRRTNGVYYYGRFVDDFIIFCYEDPSLILDNTKKLLNKLGLELNQNKTTIMHHSHKNNLPIKFDFLGYQFTKPYNQKPTIEISEKKLKKIKSRVAKSFVSYGKTNNASLLEERIKFLTSNYHLTDFKSITPIKAGIFFSYPLAKDCLESLRELDIFLRNQIFSEKNICHKMGSPLPKQLKKNLSRYSFYFGYKNRIQHDFSDSLIKNIKECWKDD